MNSQSERETVLYAFAIEPVHDRATLDRYLALHPELTEDLIDLSAELRLNEALGATPQNDFPDAGAKDAWAEFLNARPAKSAASSTVNLLAQYEGPAFVALAKSLNVPRSILTALRDGLVVPASIPSGFLRRLAAAVAVELDTLRASLVRESEVPTALAFKSDTKPAAQRQMTFRELVHNTPMTDEQRTSLLHECDEDERP
jgi:hypothetical protein